MSGYLSLMRRYGKNADTSGAAILALWSDALQARGNARATRENYVRAVTLYGSFCSLLDPTSQQIAAWTRARRRALSPSSFNAELAALRAFYRWAALAGLASDAVASRLPQSRPQQRRLPRPLTVDEAAALIAAPDVTTWRGFRDHLILRLLYETGIKPAELVALTTDDLLPDGFLRIEGDPPREIPLSSSLQHLLRALAPRSRRRAVLFVGRGRKPFQGARAVWTIVQRYSSAVGVARGIGRMRITGAGPWEGLYPHQLREACVTRMVERGVDYATIAYLLGYASADAVVHFERVDIERLRLEHAKRFGRDRT